MNHVNLKYTSRVLVLAFAVVILGVDEWLRPALIKAWQQGVTKKGYILLGNGLSLNNGIPSGSALWSVGDGYDSIVKQVARSLIMVSA